MIKKAARISDSCLHLIENSLRENITEIELRRRIRKKINSQHATLSFQTLVACGKRSAKIHPKPHATDKIIEGIGFVDFGARYRGYCSDVTVPFVKGKVSNREMKIVRTTLEAYDLAIKSLKVGVYWWHAFDKVNSFLRKNNFSLQHSLGHGIGKKVHMLPYIGRPSKKRLKKRKVKRRWERLKKMKFQEGMIFTIEPAVYVKGLCGCRLENDVLLTKKRPKILTHAKLIRI